MRTLIIFCFTFLGVTCFAQKNKQSAFDFGYTHQLPIGNLAERFGDNSAIGFSFMQEQESNIFYGIQGNYLFSNNVKEINEKDYTDFDIKDDENDIVLDNNDDD